MKWMLVYHDCFKSLNLIEVWKDPFLTIFSKTFICIDWLEF